MNVAFIPVRGGSKSIPFKNIKLINGKPLVYWAVRAACGCKYIDKVYIATDCDKIKKVVGSFSDEKEADFFDKMEVIGRSIESASDTASTEFAMIEFAANYEFENIVLIQATSPLLSSVDLDRGFEAFMEEEVDSVLSVVRQKRFYWTKDDRGRAHPANYDIFKRPRRQEFDGCLVENGAFYISSKRGLVKYQNRLFGNIKAVEMDEDTFFEIDEPSDWIIIESLMKRKGFFASQDNIPLIRMFLTDCDGCLTDGGMYYSEKGDELKKFNTRDGMGFSLLRQRGIITGIITSESVDLNRRRAEKMGLDILKVGCRDKSSMVKQLCQQYKIDLENVAYVGDDINDLEVIEMVGFGCCPANAVPVVRESADYVAETRGGEGVIREVIDKLLK
ncbi:HAD hydrolase family protein [Lacrimispora sp.]|uniref:cytidylyltransferase domain-containing protein n=1 Tax=Lacrimispora sp. TaxID=2719234 RepID=UPI00345FA248